MPRKLPRSVGTKLAPPEYEALEERARSHGMRMSEYLRFLILADLRSVTGERVFKTIEAEHTRLVILAAQQGKELTPELLRNLRHEAVAKAPTIVEQTIRLLKQHQAEAIA